MTRAAVCDLAKRGSVLLAVAFGVWAATTLTARQDRQGVAQRDLDAAQVTIRATQRQLAEIVLEVRAKANADAITRVEAVDQRCASTWIDVELLDQTRTPRRLSAGKRQNYRDCRKLRARYLAELTPAQRTEYQRRAASR